VDEYRQETANEENLLDKGVLRYLGLRDTP
jgi:hypothetical protein